MVRQQWAVLRDTFIGQRDPYQCFDEYAQLERSAGFRSTFFIEADGERWRRYGSPYKLNSAVQDILIKLIQDGWEIGLHGGYYAASDAATLKRERARLTKTTKAEILGNRQHYLRIDLPATWHVYEASGFVYDSTLGYPYHFRLSFGDFLSLSTI